MINATVNDDDDDRQGIALPVALFYLNYCFILSYYVLEVSQQVLKLWALAA